MCGIRRLLHRALPVAVPETGSADLDALTPEAVSAYAAAQDLDAMTVLTLGPGPLKFPG